MSKRYTNFFGGLVAFLLAGMNASSGFAQAPVSVNQAIGGRTLGLESICGECKLEKYSVCKARLEGPAFDKQGNLWVIGQDTKEILRITPDGACAPVAKVLAPNGLRFHKDGRLFGTDHAGGLFSMDTKTSQVTWLTNKFGDGNFHGVNDLIFDKQGGLYFTDARGSSEFVKRGQLFYRTPTGEIMRLADNLSYPNGVALSPNEDRLYVAEWGSNRVAAFPIISPGVINLEYGWIFVAMNAGRGPDGITVDQAGNLYAAHHSAGEVLVFNPRGFSSVRSGCRMTVWFPTMCNS